MVLDVRHAGIVVRDLPRSLHFYQDLLGLRVQKRADESGDYIDNMLGLQAVSVTTVKLSAPDGRTLVELLQFHSHESADPPREITSIGPTHVAFTVDNLAETYARLSEAGVEFVAPPQDSPDGYARVTFCHDPDGTPVELVEVVK